jgi:hypothetical protein
LSGRLVGLGEAIPRRVLQVADLPLIAFAGRIVTLLPVPVNVRESPAGDSSNRIAPPS